MNEMTAAAGRVRIIPGDCRDTLASLPAGSVNCAVTSPPYFGLRDYGTAQWEGGDPDCEHGVSRWDGPKQTQGAQSGHASRADRLDRAECPLCAAKRVDRQIGLEPTPAEFVAALVAVFREVRRVLRDDGTVWLNLGDSYAANRGYQVEQTKGGPKHGPAQGAGGRPQRADEYGVKPKDLIGVPWRVAFALQEDGWYLRQDIIWAKPNPMPESVRDRCTKAHEYLFLLSKSPRYHFDQAAIAEAVAETTISRLTQPTLAAQQGSARVPGKTNGNMKAVGGQETRNRRSVWTVATQPYDGAHFATMPPALAEPCILAGCPKGGTVLDPFGGAGTTGLVAARHGRNAILCELNPDYARLARDRIAAEWREPLLESPKVDAGPLFGGVA